MVAALTMPPLVAMLQAGAGGGFWSFLSDPRVLGEATLIAIGAIFIGFLVRRVWPRSMQPLLFGWLAATGVVAALAYFGVSSAGIVLWLFIAAAVLLGILALVFN